LEAGFPVETRAERSLFFQLQSERAIKNNDGSINFTNMAIQLNSTMSDKVKQVGCLHLAVIWLAVHVLNYWVVLKAIRTM
jgi:hypothetical protein